MSFPYSSVCHNYISVFLLAFILSANKPSNEGYNFKWAGIPPHKKKRIKKGNFISNTNCSFEPHLRLRF